MHNNINLGKAAPNKYLDSHPNCEKNWDGWDFFFLTALKNIKVMKETSNTLKLKCQIEQIKTFFLQNCWQEKLHKKFQPLSNIFSFISK